MKPFLDGWVLPESGTEVLKKADPLKKYNQKRQIRLRQKLSFRKQVVVFGTAIIFAMYGTSLLIANLSSPGKAFASYGMHGAKTVSSSNVILNEYTTLTANASAGATSISVTSSSLNANGRFSGSLASGELILIIQMQGATIDETNTSTYGTVSSYNNCGKSEFAQVASVPNGTTINLSASLAKSYTCTGHVQVIRVPRYSSFVINSGASVTCPAWNGSTGGVVAIESNGVSTINGSINVNAKGFRGGATEQITQTPGDHTDYYSTDSADGAEKGESIAGIASSLANGRFGRGSPANGGGGGNSHNAGGGGGGNAGSGTWNGGGVPDNSNSNWTTAWNLEGGSFSSNNSPGGGRGGYSWSSASVSPLTVAPGNSGWTGDNRSNVGGFGGHVLSHSSSKNFLGGGGGAGDSNNGIGTAGGDGGGIVFLLSGGTVSGSGSINADGESVSTSSGTPGDAGGGGGGGGTIIIYTNGAQVKNLTLNAKGGNGGGQNLNNGSEVEGVGGGGGGGYINTTNATSLTRNVNGGGNGTTNAPPMASFPPNGATSGKSGTTTTGPSNPYSAANTLPINLLSLACEQDHSSVLVTWETASEINNDFFTVEQSADGVIYKSIGMLQGAGNTSENHNYQYRDEYPYEGSSFYRLSQTDYNGSSVTFPAVKVWFNIQGMNEPGIKSVFPNPFKEEFNAQYYSDAAGNVQFILYSLNGEKIKAVEQRAARGNNSFEWRNMADVKNGIYILSMLSEDGTVKTFKVIKQ